MFGMSTKEFLSKAGAGEIVMTFVLLYLALAGDASLFLLSGNALCTIGNILWVFTLHEFPGNEKYEVVFAVLAFVSAYATFASFQKVRNAPEGNISYRSCAFLACSL
jgi:hypothetical protein